MQRIKPVNNEIYHIYNRGVEKRKIFLKGSDYFRFVHDLFEFNDQNPAPNLNYYFNRDAQSSEVGLPKIKRRPRKLLVEILAFCLMPNHIYLMLRQRVDSGITEFMRKLGTGYANYFNLKYERVGPLFQGKYKFVHIAQEFHFLHLPYYIHSNPLEIIILEWKNRKIQNINRAIKFLENYRWSSHLDYTGKENFPSVTQREFLLDFWGGTEQYKKTIFKWLMDINLETIRDITLE